jgi:hypothetical protein
MEVKMTIFLSMAIVDTSFPLQATGATVYLFMLTKIWVMLQQIHDHESET